MELASTVKDAEVWLHVSGRVDALESPALGEEISALLDEAPDHLVADLRNVGYLDSSGLAVLVRTWRRQTGADRRFSIVMPSLESAKRIFNLAGFDKVFETIDADTIDRDTIDPDTIDAAALN